MIRYLFLLISLYTITGKQAVAEGDVPDGSSCVYEQTGNKSGQITAGNTIDMTFTGYDEATIHSVTLMMRSNTSAGAGSLQMQVGQNTVWQIADAAFNQPTWYGAFSTEYVPVTRSFSNLTVSGQENIHLHLSASANSLYLQSVQINYSLPAAQPCTVRFDTHINLQINSLTESSAGAGIILPDLQFYDADWLFYGWADQPVMETSSPAQTYSAGASYYPSTDCTLHAVYLHEGEPATWYAVDSVETGTYVWGTYAPLYDAASIMRARGAVDNGRILLQSGAAQVAGDEVALPNTTFLADEKYTITRSSDTTVTIRHDVSGKYVTLGKSGKFTTSSPTRHWRIVPMDAADSPQAAFILSQEQDGQTWFVGVSYDMGTLSFYLRPVADRAEVLPMLFYSTDDVQREPSVYTSYPYGAAVRQTIDDSSESSYRVDFGTFILYIHNGEKTIRLK